MSEPLELNFQSLQNLSHEQLNSYANQKVQIRGFLYPLNEDKWILSSEPNLKSCCIGSKAKSQQQLIVKGKFENVSDSVVTLEGIFKEGTPYILEEAVAIQHSSIWILSAIVILIGCCLAIYLKNRFAHSSRIFKF